MANKPGLPLLFPCYPYPKGSACTKPSLLLGWEGKVGAKEIASITKATQTCIQQPSTECLLCLPHPQRSMGRLPSLSAFRAMLRVCPSDRSDLATPHLYCTRRSSPLGCGWAMGAAVAGPVEPSCLWDHVMQSGPSHQLLGSKPDAMDLAAPAPAQAGPFLTPGHGRASEAIKEALTWPQGSFQPPVPLTGLPVCGGPAIALLSPHLKTDTRHMGRDSSDQVQQVLSTPGWRVRSRGVTCSQNERRGLDLSLERKTWVWIQAAPGPCRDLGKGCSNLLVGEKGNNRP